MVAVGVSRRSEWKNSFRLLVVMAMSSFVADAFVVPQQQPQQQQQQQHNQQPAVVVGTAATVRRSGSAPPTAAATTTRLFLSDKPEAPNDEMAPDNNEAQEATAAAAAAEPDLVTRTSPDFQNQPSLEEQQQQQQQPPTPAEANPVVSQLKEEISGLEKSLKDKRRQLAYTQDQADDFTKAGYARKVAEMENMRRAKSMLNSSNRSGSMAAVLAEFLPIMDQLYYLKEQYAHDEFGKQYNAMPGALRAVFSELGVTEYTAYEGTVATDPTRFVAISSEYSVQYPVNTVIRPVSTGLELQGNVIRPAECVVSLGPENLLAQADAADAGGN